MQLNRDVVEKNAPFVRDALAPKYHHCFDAIVAAALSALPAEPAAWVVPSDKINELQVASIQRLIDRAKHAHVADITLRVNGKDEVFQADWLKYMTRAHPPREVQSVSEEGIRSAVKSLEAVLCDPEGNVVIIGSEGDHKVIREALDALRESVSRDDVLGLNPTGAMIEAGAQRLVSWDDGCKWPDSWSELQVAAARNDAEKVWRSMWLEASGQSHEAGKQSVSEERGGPTEEELSAMVNRFLGWRLPKDFAPDHYITFDRDAAQRAHDSTNGISWPIGTNLFTADQARAMLRYVLATHEGRSHE